MMLKKSLTAIAFTAIASLTFGCGGGGSAKNEAPIISSVTFPESVSEGDTVNVSVSAEDTDGTIREYSWVRTYGPAIDFGDTATDRAAQFIAPEVSEDTALGLLIEVVDNDGAVSQEFIEITIIDSVRLGKVSVDKVTNQTATTLIVELQFDKQPLLNSVMNFAAPCDSGISIVSKSTNQCMGFSFELKAQNLIQLSVPSIDLNDGYQLNVSNKLVDVWEQQATPTSLDNLLDEKALELFNSQLSQ